MAAWYLYNTWERAQYWPRSPFGQLCAYASRHAKGKPIFGLHYSQYPSFPLVTYSGARYPSRFTHPWLLPAYYKDLAVRQDGSCYRSIGEMDELERWHLDAIVGDLRRDRPVLVIVQTAPVAKADGPLRFDILEYFLRDGRFREFWEGYERVGRFDIYEVFGRRQAALPPFSGSQ